MRFLCRKCKLPITKDLTELKDYSVLCEEDGKDFLPEGVFFKSDGEYYTGSENKIIVNIKDLINSERHPDSSRLNGCCGLDGLDGINTICKNGHEIGTERSDCWMSHSVILELENIEIQENS
ncbi:MAG: hypothetical protein ACMUJM_24590 [bacterium]